MCHFIIIHVYVSARRPASVWKVSGEPPPLSHLLSFASFPQREWIGDITQRQSPSAPAGPSEGGVVWVGVGGGGVCFKTQLHTSTFVEPRLLCPLSGSVEEQRAANL